MFRTALIMYLGLATAIGPGFCAFPEKLVGSLSYLCGRGEKQTAQNCCLKKQTSNRSHPGNHGSKPPCKWKEGAIDPTTTKTSAQDVISNEYKSIAEDGFVAVILEMTRTGSDIPEEIEIPRHFAFSCLDGQGI